MDVRPPTWLEELPEAQARVARCRFLLRLAALYFSPEGKMNALSEELGLASGTLSQLDNISAPLAVKLEGVLGRDLFPRELFRPDLFEITGV